MITSINEKRLYRYLGGIIGGRTELRSGSTASPITYIISLSKGFASKVEMPPTAVGGYFRSNLVTPRTAESGGTESQFGRVRQSIKNQKQ